MPSFFRSKYVTQGNVISPPSHLPSTSSDPQQLFIHLRFQLLQLPLVFYTDKSSKPPDCCALPASLTRYLQLNHRKTSKCSSSSLSPRLASSPSLHQQLLIHVRLVIHLLSLVSFSETSLTATQAKMSLLPAPTPAFRPSTRPLWLLRNSQQCPYLRFSRPTTSPYSAARPQSRTARYLALLRSSPRSFHCPPPSARSL